jgi:F420-dependent oxidoreductase-like protein
MRFSIWPAASRPWDETLDLVRHCEANGWDGVYYADHFMPDGPPNVAPDGPTWECWAVIAGLAAAVPRLRLGSLVTSVTFRHPAVLAKIATAVDQISHGRLILGVGAGWQANEHAAFGLKLGSVKERLDRFEEAVEILTSMLGAPRTTLAGKYFHVQDAPNQPTPFRGRLPLLVGGRGERRTMRIAARYADEWNGWTTPEILAHKVDVLRAHCDDIGRHSAEIGISTQALLFLSTDEIWLAEKRRIEAKWPVLIGTPAEVTEIVGRYRDAGADEFIVPDVTFGTLAQRKDTCDMFMEQVATHMR